ncbi:glycosyl transferase family 2 [Candidatus Woesearchaeota archaeon B3_Woes]|nr:MAG: glycosyl transferase family 2 [Candidatus Woesearchaeota archaeon B3_Woes]
MKIAISIPAYNEEKTIGNVIEDIKKIMSHTKYEYKILVVDDGSKDNTVKIAKEKGAITYSHHKNLGLAETFKTEIERCLELGVDIIVHTDADGQYPAKEIPKLITNVEEGYDLVLGARFGKGKYNGSFMKKIGNVAFARVFSKLLRTKITDTTTGFRAFTSEVAQLPLINDFTYTQEQLIRAGKAKMKIKEVPIKANKTRSSRLFKNSLDYALKAWVNIFRIYRDFEPLRFFVRIGLMFVFVGFLLGSFILYRILTIGSAGGIPRVILSMLLILVGIQIVLFGFLADMMNRLK